MAGTLVAAASGELLAQNVPNPVRSSTSITFVVPREERVLLRVYDVSGRLIQVLFEGNAEARSYELMWDGRDARGEAVASGVYFYRITAPGFTASRKMIMLK